VAEAATDRVRLAALRSQALSVDEVLAAVRAPGFGGVVVFLGAVRDGDGGRSVVRLDYTAHPGAAAELLAVATRVAERYDDAVVAAVHRTGALEVGDLAVVVAAAAPHRDAAFGAARALIDELKATVPIWKEQLFADGTGEWVGTP
jgi:molybdopterin synthase catalytic subunit